MFETGLVPLITITMFIPLAWLITKKHKSTTLTANFPSRRAEAVQAIVLVIAVFAAIALLFSFWSQSIGKPIGSSQRIGPADVAFEWTFYTVFFFVPVLAALKVKHQTLESIGVTKKNLIFSLVIGITLSALWLTIGFSTSPESFLRAFSLNTLYGLLYYTAIGFGEEILFRGYLQHRCSTWLGAANGLVISSIIMAFAHLPQRVFALGLNPQQAILSSVVLLPISILLGLVFLKTQNVLGPAVLHTVFDFSFFL